MQWLVAYFTPFNAAMYRLNEPDKLEKSIKTMKSHQKVTVLPVFYLLGVFLRFIWFDWWLDRIGDVKHQIQTSSWWPTVRSWRVTEGLNYLWTFPKRHLFDTVSNDVNEMSSHAKQLMKSHKYYSKHLKSDANGNNYSCLTNRD